MRRHWTQESDDLIFEKGERNSQDDGVWGLNKGCLHEKNELRDYLTENYMMF